MRGAACAEMRVQGVRRWIKPFLLSSEVEAVFLQYLWAHIPGVYSINSPILSYESISSMIGTVFMSICAYHYVLYNLCGIYLIGM